MDKLVVILEKGEKSIQCLIIALTVCILVGMFLNHRVQMKALDIQIEQTKHEAKLHKMLFAMIKLESSGNHENTWGDGGMSYGWLQFQERTFKSFAKMYGLEGLDWKNKEHQYQLAYLMVRDGYGGEWSVYKRAKKMVEF